LVEAPADDRSAGAPERACDADMFRSLLDRVLVA
jgi:hypothetical protein